MRAVRRLFQVVALAGTLLVGVLAVALIVSQTPWFRDWLRRYAVRQSDQYLNGELNIGRLGGNLFFGVNLADVTLDLSGERIIAIEAVEVDYSFLDFISRGIVLDEIRLKRPSVSLERDANGWNVGRLVKEREREADREGPGRPVTIDSILVTDGTVDVRDAGTAGAYRIPERLEDLNVRASFAYEPVRYSIDVDHLSVRGSSPTLKLDELSGRIAVRDDDLFVEDLVVRTAESAVRAAGVVESYQQAPFVRMTATANVSLPEIARVLPAAEGYALHPRVELKAEGPTGKLGLDVDMQSEAGTVRGRLTADLRGPHIGAAGTLHVGALNLAPVLKDPSRESDITGTAKFDLAVAEGPRDAGTAERLKGTFAFSGPRVAFAGYETSDVNVEGRLSGPRIEIDGRAAAYGGTATAEGYLVLPAEERPIQFELRGRADDVVLRNLPEQTGAPAIETDLSVASYVVRGSRGVISGSATLNRSVIEGATFADGTTATFSTGRGTLTYSAQGAVSDFDLQRFGHALGIDALTEPRYEGRLNARFDVAGQGRSLETMRLDAAGALRDSTLMGAALPEMGFEAHLDTGALDISLNGSFADLDPARVAGQERLQGRMTGAVDARVQVSDLQAITPETITADGRITLQPSTVGKVEIQHATVDGRYANSVADLRALEVQGPDVRLNANGRVALDRTSSSDLRYRVEILELGELAQLAGQEGVSGSAVLDGSITGNLAALETTGTLDASNVGYQENNALHLNARYNATVPDLRFADATVGATTEAAFITAAGLNIKELKATTKYAQGTLEFNTNIVEETRELDARGTVIFHPDHQELHLPDLAIRTAGVEWRTAPGSDMAVQYGSGRVTLENLRLVSGDQSLEASGSFSLEEGRPAGAVTVRLQNVDIAQVEQLLLLDRGLQGRLTASAEISGTRTSPEVEGHVEIRDAGFQSYLYQSLVADVKYANRRIDLDAKLQQSPTEYFTARGTLPISLLTRSEQEGHVPPTDGELVDVRIQSSALSLGIVQGFTNQVTNVTGTLQADVRITGSGQDPHFQGHIDIRGGAFGVPAGGVSYTGLDTRIDLSTDLVRIQEFHIRDEEGAYLTVAGELAVHERAVGAVNIRLASNNFEIIDNELGDVGVGTDLRITGELRQPRIEGVVRLADARLEVDRLLALMADPYAVEPRPSVRAAGEVVEERPTAERATETALQKAEQELPPVVEPDAEADAPSAFDPVALDVRVVIPDNLVLRGRDLRPGGTRGVAVGNVNVTVGGEITVRKEPGEDIRLVGEIAMVRGTYEFQGRQFELARGGTIRFTGDPEINPLLNITATRQIPTTSVEAQIAITGTAREPQLALSSTPPLEESDILALIIFNRPVNELGTGERASLARTAGGIATGFLAAPLGESIGRALDLDYFEITTTTDRGDLGAGITVGQQIGERAFVKLRQQFGERSTSEFLLEYQLADFLRLRATAAPEASGSANRLDQRRVERAGIDLIFFFSY